MIRFANNIVRSVSDWASGNQFMAGYFTACLVFIILQAVAHFVLGPGAAIIEEIMEGYNEAGRTQGVAEMV